MGHYDEAKGQWIPDGKTDKGQDYNRVEANLFKSRSGKWGYTVYLDYTDIWHRIVNGPERTEWIAEHGEEKWEFLDPGIAAWMALNRATRNKTSDVSIRGNTHIADESPAGEGYWTLVVLDPPNGYPIMSSQLWTE